ncbi:hypothetical protein ACFLZ5_00530 [Thermodesulfobacteriota bacterium]
MSYIKKDWGLKVFVFGLVLCCGISISMAAEDQPLPETTGPVVSTVTADSAVSFKTEGDFSLGYRVISTDDSLKAAEFSYPHSSMSFGLNLLSAPLPYRYHINTEFISKHDFYLDAGFAYKDLLLFRDILGGVQHNLSHYNYSSSNLRDDNNPTDAYYKDFTSNLILLRLKTPDFPFHTFVNHRHVEKDGRIQQRFMPGYINQLGEPNGFGGINKMISESRDIEWETDTVTLGVNSHLGPVEIEYAYDQSKFDPGSNNILRYENFPAYTSSTFPDRPAGTYPHNVIPETESSAHTIKMHSSYTGGIVAAATFSNLFQKNNFSLTESTTWKGAFDISWVPDPVLGLFFKYRHKDVDMDTPGTVYLIGYNGDKTYYNNLSPVRQGMSYKKDVLTLSTRYKPVNFLSLYADYEFSHLERKDTADWELLSGRTSIHTINFTARARPLNKLKVKALYEYKNYDQPGFNTNPDNSNKLYLTTTYTPSPDLNIYAEYLLVLTGRDSLSYLDVPDQLERDGKREHFLASFTTGITPKLSFTASWYYQRMKVEQDLVFSKVPTDVPPYFIDLGVPYTDNANSFSLSFYWVPRDDFTVGADLSHTITKASTDYTVVFEGESLSSLSDFEASETSFSLDMAKKLPKDWEIGLRLFFNKYDDDTSTDFLDGDVFSSTFTMKRYF